MAHLPRIAAVALGTAAGLGLAWWALRVRGERPGPPVAFFEPSVEDARRVTSAADRAGASDAGGLVRWTVPREAAERLFPLDGIGQVYDPRTYFRYPSDLRVKRYWPGGEGDYYLVTNAQGLRENEDVAPGPFDLRVLVTGDSHVDGVCRNYQSFPNRLEQRLARARPEAAIDCINAGKGGYSFYHYLGVLERFVDLDPDVFVVTMYGGNDLVEILTLRRYFHGELYHPPPDSRYKDPLDRARAIDPGALAQGLYQAKHFQQHPEDEERALETAGRVLRAIHALCERQGIRPLLAYLPAWYDVQRERYDTAWDELLGALELDDHELARGDVLAERVMADAREIGLDVLDLRPVLRGAEVPVYWDGEWHLNPRGHAHVARALEAWVAGRFP